MTQSEVFFKVTYFFVFSLPSLDWDSNPPFQEYESIVLPLCYRRRRLYAKEFIFRHGGNFEQTAFNEIAIAFILLTPTKIREKETDRQTDREKEKLSQRERDRQAEDQCKRD